MCIICIIPTVTSRSSSWGVNSLADTESLDWTEMGEEVSSTLLRWIYTDTVSLTGGIILRLKQYIDRK